MGRPRAVSARRVAARLVNRVLPRGLQACSARTFDEWMMAQINPFINEDWICCQVSPEVAIEQQLLNQSFVVVAS